MKIRIKRAVLLLALTVGLGLLPAGRLRGQTFTTLQSFTFTNGQEPAASLMLSGNVLYGTTEFGGLSSAFSSGAGTVFRINADGTGFTNLHIFTGADGYRARGALILSGDTLFGITVGGGSNATNTFASGTVFAIKTDGTEFTNLYTFTGSDGSAPSGRLVLLGNTLYGATAGPNNPARGGTVFGINTDGTGFTNLYSFTPDQPNRPGGSLILSGTTLYGAASSGGPSGSGALFKLNADGTGSTNLYNFTALTGPPWPATNSDGANPCSGLVLSGNTLYGTTSFGGGAGSGTAFAVNTDGSNFKILHSFSASAGGNSTNYDGATPNGSLSLSGSTLYGTTSGGGDFGNGTVFAVNTDGTGFAILHTFTFLNGSFGDGAVPLGGVILSGNMLYGTANIGGSFNYGTIFSMTLPIQLAIAVSGANVILSWPTNSAGLILQSSPTLAPPVAWTGVSPDPVVINGLNVVTNPITANQQFYQLIKSGGGN